MRYSGLVFSSLRNQNYWKICGDGAYRLVNNGDFAVVSLGVITKSFGRTAGKDLLHEGYTSQFRELIVGVVDEESELSYTFLMEALLTAVKKVTGHCIKQSVRQYHADRHKGEEAARRRCFPSSCSASDYAHVVGAVRPRAGGARDSSADTVTVWRSGVFKNAQQWLCDKDWLPLLQAAFPATRVLPEALFSLVWSQIFRELREAGEDTCAENLRKHYFCHEASSEMRSATWRIAPDRLQPGSGSGSQSQESWHHHRLKAAVPHLRLDAADFVQAGGASCRSDHCVFRNYFLVFLCLSHTVAPCGQALEGLLASRAQQLEEHPEPLYDVPGLQWDHVVLHDTMRMAALGAEVACACTFPLGQLVSEELERGSVTVSRGACSCPGGFKNVALSQLFLSFPVVASRKRRTPCRTLLGHEN